MATTTDLNSGLRRLVAKHGVPLYKLAEKLDVSACECMKWWVHHEVNFPNFKVRNLTWALGATDDDLVSDRISASTVDTGILEFDEKINPKYLTNAFSYTMSSKHIVEYLHLRYGAFIAKGLLYKLGVHPNYFRTISNRISISFFEDLLREYIALGNSFEDIQRLSRVVYLTTDEQPNDNRLFPRCHTYAQAFQAINEALGSFEENFQYEFQTTSSRTVITCKPSPQLVEGMKNKFYGTRELYEYRSTGLGNFPMLCGLPAIPVKVLKCVSQGDPMSVYEFEYPNHYFLNC